MNNRFIAATLTAIGLMGLSMAVAQQVPAIDYSNTRQTYGSSGYISSTAPTVPMLSEDTIKLNSKEQKGVGLANQWKNRPDMPAMGEDGSVQFTFGTTMPSVVCAPLYACDVALQPGEVVQQMLLGDAGRWKIAPGTSGSGENAVTHLGIKPSDVGLTTNLVVHTNRRTYNIRLVSKKNDWMPLISFYYPEDTQAQWAAYYEEHREQLKAKAVYASTNPSPANLDFNYKIKGDRVSWKPIQVYSDSEKTYIQFPKGVHHGEIPVLVAFSAKNEQLVNYRMSGDQFIVDTVLNHAALIRGVGRAQQKIEIVRSFGQ